MRIALLTIVGGLAALPGACTNAGYDKARANADAWDTAKAECSAKAAETVPNPLRQIMARHTYDECLKARGWERNESVPHRYYRR